MEAVAVGIAGEVEIVVEVEAELSGTRELCLLELGLRRRRQRELLKRGHAGRRRDLRPGLQLADDPQALGGVEGAGGALERPGALGLFAGEAGGEIVGGERLP